MKNILLLLMAFFIACDNVPKTPKYKSISDSLEVRAKVDSMVKQTMHNAAIDTAGVWNAPVKILSARPIQREYSNYKNIELKFKNVSDKTITAIRFSWYGENAFGEPADMGANIVEGVGGGFTDHALRAGKTSSGEWEILSRDLKKVIIAWPYEVVFEDGTKWKAGQR